MEKQIIQADEFFDNLKNKQLDMDGFLSFLNFFCPYLFGNVDEHGNNITDSDAMRYDDTDYTKNMQRALTDGVVRIDDAFITRPDDTINFANTKEGKFFTFTKRDKSSSEPFDTMEIGIPYEKYLNRFGWRSSIDNIDFDGDTVYFTIILSRLTQIQID